MPDIGRFRSAPGNGAKTNELPSDVDKPSKAVDAAAAADNPYVSYHRKNLGWRGERLRQRRCALATEVQLADPFIGEILRMTRRLTTVWRRIV